VRGGDGDGFRQTRRYVGRVLGECMWGGWGVGGERGGLGGGWEDMGRLGGGVEGEYVVWNWGSGKSDLKTGKVFIKKRCFSGGGELRKKKVIVPGVLPYWGGGTKRVFIPGG